MVKHDYKFIVDKLIKKSFPELRRSRIFIFKSNGFFIKEYLGITHYFIWFSFVGFNKRLGKYIRIKKENTCDKISIEKRYAKGLFEIRSKPRKNTGIIIAIYRMMKLKNMRRRLENGKIYFGN